MHERPTNGSPHDARQQAVDAIVHESDAVASDWKQTKQSIAQRLDALRRILPHDSPLADALVAARDEIRQGG